MSRGSKIGAATGVRAAAEVDELGPGRGGGFGARFRDPSAARPQARRDLQPANSGGEGDVSDDQLPA
jgi:hypothetical protein